MRQIFTRVLTSLTRDFFALTPVWRENTAMTEFSGHPDQNIEQLVDTDPSETAEWQASFDAALSAAGPVRTR